MRRLHQEELRVLGEMPDRLAQELAGRRVVGVEDDDQLAARNAEAIVEIAGLGVHVARRA